MPLHYCMLDQWFKGLFCWFSLQSLSNMSDIDVDTYQSHMENVLAWLLDAEDHLSQQEPVSDSVEKVKEQFHTHEVTILRSFVALMKFFRTSIFIYPTLFCESALSVGH